MADNMTLSRHRVPPLSPVLLAGLALRPVPPLFLQPALSAAYAVMRRRHSGVFERLAELGDALIVIDPVDLPIVFLLRPGGDRPGLRAARDGAGATATIRGPLLALIDLLEGRVDGDALFFSRDLVIEGDTEAVLILRNAVDAEEIDVLDDLTSVFGPLAGPARKVAEGALAIFSRLEEDMEILRLAMAAPSPRQDRAEAGESHGAAGS